MPRMPSNFVMANAMPGSETASAKVTFGREMPLSVNVSTERKPLIEPEPYRIEKGCPFSR